MHLRLLYEGFRIAAGTVSVNKLRTFLSLFGITIGIFAIISVFTVVDWMERSVRNSIATLGDDVVYVQKMPWSFDMNIPWWDMIRWPSISPDDYESVRRGVPGAGSVSYNVTFQRNLQYGNRAAGSASIWATTHEFQDLRSFEIENGRYFSLYESTAGRPVAIIGWDVAQRLFEEADPLGKEITIERFRVTVIGVFRKEGSGGLGDSGLDEVVVIPVAFSKNFVNFRSRNLDSFIMARAREGVAAVELTDDIIMAMRSHRRLSPEETSNFSVNRASLLSQGFDSVFAGINLGGWLIGGFSILVGGFGIANIMFVSVRERTNQIGIQKALGSKRWFILYQFLLESVILATIGGIMGLIIIFAGTLIVNYLFEMGIMLTAGNIISGLLISCTIGIVAGFAPAHSASKMNPVEAIGYSF